MARESAILKITPPRLPSIIQRPRLINRLEDGKDKRLILILGQAAQGKTTLAADYIVKSDAPYAWLNLLHEDSDPVNFFQLLVRSVSEAASDVDLSDLARYPGGVMGPREEISLYREWAWALFRRLSVKHPIRIVFDGLDRLEPDAGSFRFLNILIEELPPHVSFILLSRSEPPFGVLRMKMSREALILTNDELAFTPEEVGAFFKNICSMPLSADQAAKIRNVTEGWVGGLILLSDTLSRLSEEQRIRFIKEDLPVFFKQEIFRYFADEIFNAQPPAVRDFLIKASILDVIDPGSAGQITGTDNSEAILQDFVRRNLFVQSIQVGERGLAFRFHQLFRDFLRSRFDAEIPVSEKKLLFVETGRLHERQGHPDEAVKYYLEAEDFERAADVIELIGQDLVHTGRTGDLARWLGSFPEDMINDNPWLLFFLSMTKRFRDIEGNIQRLERALNLFQEKQDTGGHLLSLAFLIESTLYGGGDRSVPLSVLTENGETILESIKEDAYLHERAILWFQLGIGYTLRGDDPRKGFRACQTAHLLAKKSGDASLQLYALIYSLISLTWLGEFKLADEINLTINNLLKKSSHPELEAVRLKMISELAIFRGDRSLSEEVLRRLDDHIEVYGFIYLMPLALLSHLLFKMSFEVFDGAEETGTQMLNMATSMEHSFAKAVSYAELGFIYYRKRDYRKARDSIEKGIVLFSSNKTGSVFHLNGLKQVLGLTLYHLEEYETAEKELTETLDYYCGISDYFSAIDSHFGLALLEKIQGRFEEVKDHLQKGFFLAEERGYAHFMGLSRQDLLTSCITAIALDVRGAMDYAEHLLCTRLSSEAGPELERLVDHPNPDVQKKGPGDRT